MMKYQNNLRSVKDAYSLTLSEEEAQELSKTMKMDMINLACTYFDFKKDRL